MGPDGRRIASSGLDQTFGVCNVRHTGLHGHQDGVNGIDFSPDQTNRQWDVPTGIQTGPLIRTGDDAA